VTDLHEQLRTTLSGYTVERELGGGGMSRVFVAEDTRLGRRIVVKVLHPDLAVDMSAARFEREIRLAARLQHPHIVPLLSAGDINGLPYYTMPFVDGESLRFRLSRDGALSIANALRLIRELADGLAYAHEHGVIHRDLKPENVLLSASHAMVTDFGVAKALSVATQSGIDGDNQYVKTLTSTVGAPIGTLGYMAPEQAVGDPATDHRADLYALGVIAYETLTGQHPFSGRSPQAMLAAHLTEAPPSLIDRRPDVPPAVAELVARLLQKRAIDRPQSAAEVMATLDSISAPTETKPAVTATTNSSRRRIRVVALASALGLMVLIAVLVLASRRKTAPQQPVLAVLPFENLGEPGDAYFADGLTDEVTSRLAGVSGLRVIGRASARQYKGSTKSPREIAGELGASHLLTGTVRWDRSDSSNGRVRVSPELLRASDQSTVWAEPYEGPLSDVFRVQATVAERVAGALDVALLGGEHQTVAVRPTSNLAAYDAYLRGLASSTRPNRFIQSSVDTAIADFERAVALDPTFALAHAHLSRSYLDKRLFANDPAYSLKAKARAERAVALDPTQAESQFALASILREEWDTEGAYTHIRAAVKAAPSNTEMLYFLAETEEIRGNLDHAMEIGLRAEVLDPRSPDPPAYLSGLYDHLGRYQDGIKVREREIALSPDNGLAYAAQVTPYLLWRADTINARRVLERGGASVVPWMIAAYRAGGAIALWESSLTPAARLAKDTLTYAGFVRNGIGAGSDQFHLMKLHHFIFAGQPSRARSAADSIIRIFERTIRQNPNSESAAYSRYSDDLKLFALAIAYGTVGRAADAARVNDLFTANIRRRPAAGDYGGVEDGLSNAAFADVLMGRHDQAIAKLRELARRPAPGWWISPAVLREDLAWAPLRGNSDFRKLIAELDTARRSALR
jgi:eukaryotic-like serine/threonine-protein kinase